ncbi:hypothetical protein [Pseudomonas sp. CGJS7]|uniref:hypothetical protein n=1 Tax=Pseudomonas sp. CGJS7 TaxID=3109348 RepID=UPI003008EBD4
MDAATRSITILLAGALLLLASIFPSAHAADYSRCESWDEVSLCADEGKADMAARASVRAHAIASGVSNPNVCLIFRGETRLEYGHQLPACDPTAGSLFRKQRVWPEGAKCEDRDDSNARVRINLNQADWSATECHEGCRYNVAQKPYDCIQIDAGPAEHIGNNCFYKAAVTSSVCSADDPPRKPEKPDDPPKECAAGQKRLPDGKCANKGDCPTGQHMAAGKCTPDGSCPAAQVKGPDGSCVDESCPSGQAKGKDGTCKPDGDGDGDPDDGEDSGKFSGGDDCKTPPKCSGDNILCGQARIQWRIDCNTRKNRTVTDGGCGIAPVCTGEKCDAVETAQLYQQWRTACVLQHMAGNGGVGGNPGQPEWTKPTGMTQDPGQGSAPGDTNVWAPSERIDGSTLNSTGFVGGGGTCPGFPASGGGSISSGFFQVVASPPPFWCSFINWAALVINIFALISAIYILARP